MLKRGETSTRQMVGWTRLPGGHIWHQVRQTGPNRYVVACFGQEVDARNVYDYRMDPVGKCSRPACQETVEP